jgi:hypothetical protein
LPAPRKKPLPHREPSQSTANGPVVAPPEAAEEKALLQRDTRQLDSQEDGLSPLSKEIADPQEKHTQVQEQWDHTGQESTLAEHF